MILYKYLTAEKADEWLIGENSILLTPPKYLNDLLEFRIRREPADLPERREMFEIFQKEKPSALTFEEYDRSITRTEYLDGEPEDMRRMFSETSGVVSLTTDPVNWLMWAHYGLHSGVAIGYRSEEVDEHNGIKFSFLPIGIAMKVEYSNEVTPFKKSFSDAARQLTRKQECWSYECEWRIIKQLEEARPVYRDEKIFYTLSACRDEIAHIVFGAIANPEFIERIKSWLRGSPVRIQKLRINPVTHELTL